MKWICAKLTIHVFFQNSQVNLLTIIINEAFEFDEERFKCCVDKDFPGWTKLKETIERFHSKSKSKSKSKYRYVGKIVWDITPTLR